MPNSKKPYKRSRLFVDAQVQGSLIRQLIIHWALMGFLMFLYLFSLQAFGNGFTLSFKDNLLHLGSQYGILAVVLLVISPVFIYDTVKLSNRFVGPMVKFRSTLKQLANGEDVQVGSFRQNDFWNELSRELNAVSDELKELRAYKSSMESSTGSGEAPSAEQASGDSQTELNSVG